MKKTSLSIVLIIIIVSSIGLVSKAEATGTATVTIAAVKSGTTNVSSWTIANPDFNSTEISVDLYVSNALNVWCLKTDLTWNTSLLNLTSVAEGTFLKKNPNSGTLFIGGDPTTWKINSNGDGYVSGGVSDTRLTATKTNNTIGIFATLTFNVIGYGQTNISLSNGVVADTTNNPSVASLNSAIVTITNSSSANNSPAMIDAFTDKGGVGQGVNSGTYSPQELINAYALVTYNNVSVANIDVSFNVFYPNGTLLTTRTSSTNSSGYAQTQFHVPSSDSNNPSALFGNWMIMASASVSQTVVNDSVVFPIQYLVSIGNIQFSKSVYKLDNLTLQIPVNSIDNSNTWSSLEITLFDHAQVPIGSYTATNNQAKQNSTISASILIPDWAFIGQGTAYICLLAKDGTAVASESVVNFEVLSVMNIFGVSFVVPEYSFGALVALIACFAAAFVMRSKNKKNILQ